MSEKGLTQATGVTESLSFRSLMQMREFMLAIIVIVVFITLSITAPHFLNWQNLRTLLSSMSIDGIIVIGMTILLISGGFDLSVGSVMALSMIVTATLFRNYGINPWISGIIALGVSAVVGWVIGMLVTKVKLTHFIVTLCMMGIARGLVMTIAGGTNISLVSQIASVPSYQFLGTGALFGLPIQVVIFLVLAIVADFFVRRSKIMRVVFYTGSNRKAAEYSGIRASRVVIGASIVCSVCAGIAGVMYLSRFAGVPLTAGVGLEMAAISACVIGGASLTGGKGSILGSVLGLAFMALVTNAMIMFGVRAHSQELVRFSILLAAVALDQIQQNMAQKRAQ